MKKKFIVIMFICVVVFGCNSKTYNVILYTTDAQAISNQVDTIVEVEVRDKPTYKIVAETYRKAFFENRPNMPNLEWNKVTADENGMVTIDFTEVGLRCVSGGSFLEITTLNGLAKSILKNDSEVNSVTYSVDGKEYVSGHFAFEYGIPYMTRDTKNPVL